jgi:zinc transport system permease protein
VAGRALFAIVVDEESARVAGLPVMLLNGLLVGLAAVAIVASTQVVGVLLVAALMVLPVATGRQIARSFRGTLTVSIVVGVVSVVVGLALARIWALAPGGAIVLTAAAAFLVTALTTGLRRTGAASMLAGPGH